ncbi:MAG: hypothetical protein QM589_11665 [Thermomicrobiales bacterium]
MSARISAAVFASDTASRPLTVTNAPSRASVSAVAFPNPPLDAAMIATFPASPRSIASAPLSRFVVAHASGCAYPLPVTVAPLVRT